MAHTQQQHWQQFYSSGDDDAVDSASIKIVSSTVWTNPEAIKIYIEHSTHKPKGTTLHSVYYYYYYMLLTDIKMPTTNEGRRWREHRQ